MARLRTLIRRRAGTERGAELIEMAIVTPILLLILAGIFDFGFLFRSWQVVTNAAREGARVGVLPAFQCVDNGDVEARVQAYMAGSGFPDSASYTVAVGPTTITAGTQDFSACVVTVQMFQQLPSLSVIGQFFGGAFTSVPVAAGAVMRTEAPLIP
jgi:Flp pilus assembly protein TadG